MEGLERFADSIFRFLDSENLVSLPRQGRADAPFEFVGSRQLGGSWLLNGMWDRLGIRQTLEKLLSKRNYSMPVERMLFALVANRALNPSSKLYMEHWVKEEAFIPGLPEVDAHNLYRAMDFLLEAADSIQEEVFFQVASLFDLEVDLIFLDTTTTYFEVPSEDDDFEPENPEEEPVFGLRKRSKHSKDKRPDLPQAVIAFAVTRTGIPVFVKLVVANPSNFHYDYDAMFSSDLGSSFERSGFNQTLSSLAQSLVEPVHRSGCLALANA